MRKILLTLIALAGFGIASFSYAMHVNNILQDGTQTETLKIHTGTKAVFSLSRQIDSIGFNKDSGFTIRTLIGGEWIDMSENASDYVPIQGYMIRNVSEGALEITFTYSQIDDSNDALFQKTLKAGWNLVGPAFKNDDEGKVTEENAFGNLPYSQVVDFTGNGFLKKGTVGYYSGEAIIGYVKDTYSGEIEMNDIRGRKVNNHTNKRTDIRSKSDLLNISLVENIAYGVFVNNDTIMPGSQKTLVELLGTGTTIVPSVYSSFGTNDQTAELTLLFDDGGEDIGDSDVLLKSLKIEITNTISTGSLTVYNSAEEVIGTAGVYGNGTQTVNIIPTDIIETGGEVYRIETSAQAEYSVLGNGIRYSINGDIFPTNSADNINLGTYNNDLLGDLFGTGSIDLSIVDTDNISVFQGSQDVQVLDISVVPTGEALLDRVSVMLLDTNNDAISNNNISEAILYVHDSLGKVVLGSTANSSGSLVFEGINFQLNENTDFSIDVDLVEGSTFKYPIAAELISFEVKNGDNEFITNNIVSNDSVSREVTVNETGKIITLYYDETNADNEFNKQSLAGDEVVIGSLDVKALNESVEVGTVIFTLTGATNLDNTVVNATLLLDGQEIGVSGTNVNSDITDTTITFSNIDGLIIPETITELALRLNTANIGGDFVGVSQTDIFITGVILSDVVGINSQVDISPTDIVSFAGDTAKTLDIVTVIITPSIVSIFGTDDQTAEIRLIGDVGNNTSGSGNTLDAILTALKFEVSNLSGTGGITLFDSNGTQIGSSGAFNDGYIMIDVNSDIINNNDETYRIETYSEGIYRLAKDGVTYDTAGSTITSKLENTLELGQYTNSN